MTPWGQALEALRTKRGISKNRIATSGVMSTSTYRRLLDERYSKNGPTVLVLNHLLAVLGCTWKDWAVEFQRTMSPNGVGVASNGERRKMDRGPTPGHADRRFLKKA